ncbi:MAG: DUF2490 domain-containing protein [Sandaracinaceae bacterium]|nr:DUF2490 domain-containing protein [Sandaracinaceae bacterium]
MKIPSRLLVAAFVSAMALGTASGASAQTSDFSHQYQTWIQFNFMGPISGDWFFQSDVQYRGWDNFSPQAFLVRGALLYRLMDNMYVGLGYAWQPFWRQRDLVDWYDDHRIYEQWQWEITEPSTGIKLSLRTRFEQRFRHPQEHFEFGLRARQQVRLVFPLTTDRNLMLIVWDEIFVNFTDSGHSTLGQDGMGATQYSPQWQYGGLDQNRAFLGVGYQFIPSVLRVELGYQNQWVRRPNRMDGDLMGHTGLLVTTINWR